MFEKIRKFFSKENPNKRLKIGVIIMILCIPFFIVFPPIIAFMELSGTTKVTASLVSLIIGEVLFYGGGILVGADLFKKYKSYMDPRTWFKKKVKPEDQNKEEEENQ